jgi:hypothetical protein
VSSVSSVSSGAAAAGAAAWRIRVRGAVTHGETGWPN